MALTKTERRNRIKKRIRKVVSGSTEIPRLTVFRSNQHIYAQLVDDDNKKTITAVSSKAKYMVAFKGSKTEQAKSIGKLIAEKAKEFGVEKVVFDRNGYLYHGRVKALADAARENGLKF